MAAVRSRGLDAKRLEASRLEETAASVRKHRIAFRFYRTTAPAWSAGEFALGLELSGLPQGTRTPDEQSQPAHETYVALFEVLEAVCSLCDLNAFEVAAFDEAVSQSREANRRSLIRMRAALTIRGLRATDDFNIEEEVESVLRELGVCEKSEISGFFSV